MTSFSCLTAVLLHVQLLQKEEQKQREGPSEFRCWTELPITYVINVLIGCQYFFHHTRSYCITVLYIEFLWRGFGLSLASHHDNMCRWQYCWGARLDEAWALLYERVELCRRHDASAQAEREEALRFAKETHDSVKREAAETMAQLDAAREALEAETASNRQEVAALEQNFITHSKTVESSLKELRELRKT